MGSSKEEKKKKKKYFGRKKINARKQPTRVTTEFLSFCLYALREGLHSFQFQQGGTFHPLADCLRLCQRHFQHCAGTDTVGQRGQTRSVVVVVVVVAVVVGVVAAGVGVVAAGVGAVVQVVAQGVCNRC